MEKNVWGVLIQKPLGTQGKRKMTTPTAPKNQNEVVLIQKHRNLRHPQGFLGLSAWPPCVYLDRGFCLQRSNGFFHIPS